MISNENIEKFFGPQKMAIAGVSRNPKKFSTSVFNELRKKGIDAVPVNPHTDNINGAKCYRKLSDVPEEYRQLLIMTPKSQTDNVFTDALNAGYKNVWIQQMSDTETSVQLGKEHLDNFIYGKCIMMFALPVKGIHAFHRGIVKLFGRLPK